MLRIYDTTSPTHPPTQVFASSFIGEGVNSQAIRNSAGHDIFWIPNFWSTTDVSQVRCLLINYFLRS